MVVVPEVPVPVVVVLVVGVEESIGSTVESHPEPLSTALAIIVSPTIPTAIAVATETPAKVPAAAVPADPQLQLPEMR